MPPVVSTTSQPGASVSACSVYRESARISVASCVTNSVPGQLDSSSSMARKPLK